MEQIWSLFEADKLQDLKQLLQQQPTLAKAQNAQGISLLLLSAYHRKTAFLDFLLSLPLSLNLHEAAAVGDLKTVQEELEKTPAAIEEYAPDGFTPLGLACFFGQLHIVHYLIEKGANVNQAANNAMQVAPIHSAVAMQQLPIVKLLLGHGANPNALQTQNISPLHSAAHQGQLDMVQLLIQHGASPTAQTADGRTPLDFAKADGHKEVQAFLEAVS